MDNNEKMKITKDLVGVMNHQKKQYESLKEKLILEIIQELKLLKQSSLDNNK
tara:strand:- start:184 stop:339 length:156 start_codon:yes stop_codon:yes gene_type:complete